MSKTLGFGILGAGLVSPFHAKVVTASTGGKLISIADIDNIRDVDHGLATVAECQPMSNDALLPSKDFSYDFFLAHSSKDKPIAHDLATHLKSAGSRVWLDDWIIRPGDAILRAIQKGLEHSRTLALLMSDHTFDSEWAGIESNTFLFRNPTNDARRFIPVLIANCRIPDMLQQFRYIDARTDIPKAAREIIATLSPSPPTKFTITSSTATALTQTALTPIETEKHLRLNYAM